MGRDGTAAKIPQLDYLPAAIRELDQIELTICQIGAPQREQGFSV
jgi:hypothetical protein